MARIEIIAPDSLRQLSGQFQRMQQELNNLRRRLSAFRCELDDVVPYKKLCRFVLNASMATSDPTGSGLLTEQYGEGTAHSTGAITVNNMLTGTAATYLFKGSSGNAGLAYYSTGTDWRILQMECT